MDRLFRKNRKGFTLIELIVVIAILAILAAIAIPTFVGITDQADAKVALANARNIATAFNAYQNLNPHDMLGDDTTLADAQTALASINLWPSGLDDADATTAWALITITGGVAVAAEAAVAEEPV
ncbi:MAG: prepilin-type N-terminal cleavage/methylation domain-containing protein [Eubacteriales bacterium]|nr:prepilin-type N-terminal cleavage/methylation domain-containing protein [Eubacteriales bacterium]